MLLDFRMLRSVYRELVDRLETLSVRKKPIGSRNCLIGLLVERAPRALRLFGALGGLQSLVFATERR